VSRIYWDSMLFIYWLEGNPQFGRRVDAIWSQMQKRNDQRGANQERVQRAKVELEIAVSEVIPFTLATADLYGRIRGSLKVSSADAIHLACAANAGTDLFLTNDKKLVGKVIPGIQFIVGLDSNIL